MLRPDRPPAFTRLTPDGKASIIFAPQELQVQALVVDASGAIYAATSPDGKVYKIVHGGPAPGKTPEGSHTTEEIAAAQEGARPGADRRESAYHRSASIPATAPASTSIPRRNTSGRWRSTGKDSSTSGLETAAKSFASIRTGSGSLFFKSDEAQIRALDFDNLGNLIAGTDGSGLIYRISQQGEGFVLYSAPKKEITALAVDSKGDIYAAGAGEKRGPAPGSATPTPSIGIVVTAPAPGSGTPTGAPAPAPSGTPSASTFTSIPYPNTTSTGGSEIYRLSPDGSPKTIWSSREDLVYCAGLR